MSSPLHTYDLLKSIVQLSNSSIPIDVKLDQMLQSISGAFQSDRCLLLKPEKIRQKWFSFPSGLGKKTLMGRGGIILPERECLLRGERAPLPNLRLHSLVRWDLFPRNSLHGFLKALPVFPPRDGSPPPDRGGDGRRDSK